MELLKYVNDVNILLVVLDILVLIISFLFLNKRGGSPRVKDIFVIVYTLINLFLFSYVNSLFQSIFTLRYLSVRSYLIVVLISLFIFLYTFNKKIKLFYKLANYLMVVLISVILMVNIYIVVSESLKVFNVMDISNSIILMNISFIIFGGYLGVISFVYIGYYLYDLYLVKKHNKIEDRDKVVENNSLEKSKKKFVFDKFKGKIGLKKDNVNALNFEMVNNVTEATNKDSIKNKLNVKEENDDSKEIVSSPNNKVFEKGDNNSLDDDMNKSLINLLNYRVGDRFYINGVDCSIIFCDSNKENIVKNYDILSKDINAKLVNGYTLAENIMIKDICNKLNIGNLAGIDINNLGLLNVINVDEYMFLKKILGEN